MKRLFNVKHGIPKPAAFIKRNSDKSVIPQKSKTVSPIAATNKITAKTVDYNKSRKFNIKIIINWFKNHWRGIISLIIISALAILTLSLELNTLLPGQNSFETSTLIDLKSLPIPWDKAVNAVYTIPAYLVGSVLNNPLQGARVVSVVYGLISTALLFYILRKWFNIRIATVGSLLFITSSWVLHITHLASPLILLVFGPLLILAALAWFTKTKNHKTLAFIALILSLAFTAYISYMPWIIFIVFCILFILERRNLSKLKTWQIAVSAGIYFVMLLPLALSIIEHPNQLHELLGIPQNLPNLHDYLARLAYTLSMIVFRSAPLPELHLGTLPMLDIFSAAMLFLGVFYFMQRIRSHHSIIIFSSSLVLLLLVPLSPLYQLSTTILLSFVYIFVISGIVELLNQWFSYFPRNPWARNFGVSLIVIAIGFSSFYHLQRYFVAWPNAPETKNAYIVVVKK